MNSIDNSKKENKKASIYTNSLEAMMDSLTYIESNGKEEKTLDQDDKTHDLTQCLRGLVKDIEKLKEDESEPIVNTSTLNNSYGNINSKVLIALSIVLILILILLAILLNNYIL